MQDPPAEIAVASKPGMLQGDDSKYDKDYDYDENNSENSHGSMILYIRVTVKVPFPRSI